MGAVIAFAGNIIYPFAAGNPAGQPSYTTNTESQGWMVWDGSQRDKIAYGFLYAAIGDLYNTGAEAEGKFSVPDYRGYFLRMVDMGAGIDPDASKRISPKKNPSDTIGSMQKDALQYHEHEANNASKGTLPPGQEGPLSVAEAKQLLSGEPANSNNTVRTSTETRPCNIYVYYLIKFLP